MERITLAIEGMSCGHCVRAVESALKRLPGVAVEHVAVGEARVRVDPSRVKAAEVVHAVEEAGYPARVTEGAEHG